MATKSKVSLIKCENYNPAEVESALHKALEPLGGISNFVKPGQTVLIKPNALLGKSPESAVTTHPSLVAAVVKEVLRAGATPLVGDSPGNAYANVTKTIEKTGIISAVEAAGGKMVYFQQEGIIKVKNPSGNKRMEQLHIAQPATSADVIINLPKLKTHNLTAYTGAIKNMFGVIPGFNKANYHASSPLPRNFSSLLVDIYQSVMPKLNIMDAVIGMEGHGPSNGKPRKLGLIIASADGVALDAVGSFLIGFKPEQILTTAIAYKRKLGEMRLENIDICGCDHYQVRQKDWKKAVNLYSFLAFPFLSQIKILPFINQDKCTRCQVCVKSCPTKTINYDLKRKKVEINPKNCISCFCCHELCEFDAVNLRRSWLVKLLGIGNS